MPAVEKCRILQTMGFRCTTFWSPMQVNQGITTGYGFVVSNGSFKDKTVQQHGSLKERFWRIALLVNDIHPTNQEITALSKVNWWASWGYYILYPSGHHTNLRLSSN